MLVLLVGCLYLNLYYVTSAFSLPLDHQHFSNSLQHLTHSHINISHASILSLRQHHHLRLNYFTINFIDNKFKKIN
jgi:hypothetical protein